MQNYAFASAGSLITRHCKLEASEYAFLPLLAFATRHYELEASNFIFLPFCTFSSLFSVLSSVSAQMGRVR